MNDVYSINYSMAYWGVALNQNNKDGDPIIELSKEGITVGSFVHTSILKITD